VAACTNFLRNAPALRHKEGGFAFLKPAPLELFFASHACSCMTLDRINETLQRAINELDKTSLRIAETKTQRVHRTWFERLKMWRHAYETKVFDEHCEALGRGPTPGAARDAALKRWNEQIERWKEQNAENK
jgi:hypothetical protein